MNYFFRSLASFCGRPYVAEYSLRWMGPNEKKITELEAERDDLRRRLDRVREWIKVAYHGGGLPLTIADGRRWMDWADTLKRGLDAILSDTTGKEDEK